RPQRRQIHRRSQRKQALVRADIAGCLLAADVLLARLQGQHPAALAGAVHGLAYNPARNLAHEWLAAGHHAEVRPAELHRRAEHLPFADSDIRAVLTGALEQADADAIEADDKQNAFFLADFRDRIDFSEAAEEIRVLHDDPEGLF